MLEKTVSVKASRGFRTFLAGLIGLFHVFCLLNVA